MKATVVFFLSWITKRVIKEYQGPRSCGRAVAGRVFSFRKE